MATDNDLKSDQLADNTVITIIGLGGVGSILKTFLAMYLRTVKNKSIRLVLVDGDSYEPRNDRVDFAELGNKAAVSARDVVRLLGEHSDITVVAIDEFVGPENVERLIHSGVVCLCVDNHATRKLVCDRLKNLQDVVCISGGNDGVEPSNNLRGTYGNCSIHVRSSGRDVSMPIDRLHPEIQNPKDALPNKIDCLQAALSTPQILCANLTVAAYMLNSFFAVCCCNRVTAHEVTFDILDLWATPVEIDGVNWLT